MEQQAADALQRLSPSDLEDQTCSICVEPFNDYGHCPVQMPNCPHNFGLSCIRRRLVKDLLDTCPTCKKLIHNSQFAEPDYEPRRRFRRTEGCPWFFNQVMPSAHARHDRFPSPLIDVQTVNRLAANYVWGDGNDQLPADLLPALVDTADEVLSAIIDNREDGDWSLRYIQAELEDALEATAREYVSSIDMFSIHGGEYDVGDVVVMTESFANAIIRIMTDEDMRHFKF